MLREAVHLDFPHAEVTVEPASISFTFSCAPSRTETVSAEVAAVIEYQATGAICDVEMFGIPEELLARLEPLHSRKVPASAGTFACADFEAGRLWLHLAPGPPVSELPQRCRVLVATATGECRIAVVKTLSNPATMEDS